jgi:type II secretory pathway component PulF
MQMKSPAAGLSAETSGFLSQTCHNLMSNLQTDTETRKKKKKI